ncbi:MAG TPA: hypothetical protein VFX30_03940 [bacterium]|nr:hypothetical protein [bacterium]
MAITNLFSNLSISLQTIAPSLQAAAQGMDGAEFCRFTEEVRDHYAAGRFLDLHTLLEGRGVEPTMEGARQMIFARMQIFQEEPPVEVLGELKLPEGAGALSPEDHYSSLLYELRSSWANLKAQREPFRWEEFLLDVKSLLTRADGALGHLQTRLTWETLAYEYHILGRREDVLEIYRNLENEALNDDSDEGTEHENWKLEDLIRETYIPLGYLDEAERLLEAGYVSRSCNLFIKYAEALIKEGQKERARTFLTERLLPEALERMPLDSEEEEALDNFDFLFRTARLLLRADLKEKAARLLRPLAEVPLKAFLREKWDNRDGFIVTQTKEILAALSEATAVSEIESFLSFFKETALLSLRSGAPTYRSVTMALELATFATSLGISDDTVRALIEVFSIEDYVKHAPQPAEEWLYRMKWDSELLAFTKMRLRSKGNKSGLRS